MQPGVPLPPQYAPQQPGYGYPAQPPPGSMPSSPFHEPISSYNPWNMGLPEAPSQPKAPPEPTVPPPPPSAFQHWLIRTFQQNLAGNAIFGIVVGALVALVAGGLVAIMLESIFHALAPHIGYGNNGPGGYGQDILDYVLGLVPLHSSFRDGMQLLFVAQGAGGHIQYIYGTGSSSGSSSTYDFYFNAILNGLLIIPALFLTLGGYIAASTDLQNKAMQSLLRGVAIALPYALLMIALVPQVNGSVPLSPGISISGDTQALTYDSASIFFLSLLWGAIFGLLGASLKLGRGHWRQMMTRFLAMRPQRLITGMLTGGLAATGLGIALSFLVVCSFLAYSTFSVPIFVHNLCDYGRGFADWQFISGWAIAQGPLHAVNLFSFSLGAPVTISNPSALHDSCFYTYGLTGSADHYTLSLLGGSTHLPSWTFAFLLLPVISLFLGGRISAAYGRAESAGQGFIQGATIAVPLTILMMVLSVYSSLNYQYSGPFTSSGTTTSFTENFGVGAFDMLLWTLLSGAILGGLGGAYQVGNAKQGISRMLAGLVKPLKVLGAPGFMLVDALRGRPRNSPRTTALRLLYGSAFATILLLIAVVAAAVLLISLNASIAYTVNYRIRDILSVALVALPGLLLISAGAAALAEEKLPAIQLMPAAPMAPVTALPPFQQPMPSYQQPLPSYQQPLPPYQQPMQPMQPMQPAPPGQGMPPFPPQQPQQLQQFPNYQQYPPSQPNPPSQGGF